MVGNERVVLAGVEVALCDCRDNLVFEVWKPLIGNGMSKNGALLKALIEGLNAALALDLKGIPFFCILASVGRDGIIVILNETTESFTSLLLSYIWLWMLWFALTMKEVTENGKQERHLVATVGKFSVVWDFQQVKNSAHECYRNQQGLKSCCCYKILLKDESIVESRFTHDNYAVTDSPEAPLVVATPMKVSSISLSGKR
ncbi:unnamed protein product [Prunus armeniaca]|uniref:RNase H type-1 domain-containing protein n=1 Tax=Prunus armeniaca TaxID=36596 RepID=A0A6J5Y8P2_PRUAR|nr:unnamed protein product [Prunus armeniaca]